MLDPSRRMRLSAALLAGGLFGMTAAARSETAAHAKPPASSTKVAAPKRKSSPYHPVKETNRAKSYYAAAWGVDKLKVSRTASGNLIRFSFRIVEPARAAPLLDKKATPQLLGLKSLALLTVPAMEKIGPLRQSGEAKAGQEYWMTFSNKGQHVKPGERVNVTIGRFHADGLMVE